MEEVTGEISRVSTQSYNNWRDSFLSYESIEAQNALQLLAADIRLKVCGVCGAVAAL